MSGIYQKQVNSGSVAAPSANRTLISVNESGELFTKDSSGNVIVYPTSSNGGGGGGSPFPFTGSADISGTLNVDFTDTLSYISEEDYEIPFGKAFFGAPLNWQDLTFSGNVIGSVLTEDDFGIHSITLDGQTNIPSIGLSFPTNGAINFLQATSGSVSGSSIASVLNFNDLTALGEGKQYLDVKNLVWIDPIGGDLTQMQGVFSFFEDSAYYDLTKQNNAGERIVLNLNDSQEGFRIYNDLSDNSASVLRVEDNNGDARLEVKNDGVTLSDLTIDFTDTLSYVTGDEEFGVGLQNFGSWLVPTFSGSVIGSKLTQDSGSIYNITGDGSYVIPGFGGIPAQVVGTHLNITDGILLGSSLSNIIVSSTSEGDPSYGHSNISTYVDPVSGDITQISQAYIMDEPGSTWDIQKINNSGEDIKLELASDATGFKLSNNYSDNTASVLRIEDINGDATLEFFNDYLVSETIPALDYADDAAAATGGVPVGGIYHNSGSIRIRLT